MAGYWEGFTEQDIGFYLGNNEEKEKGSAPKREANKLQGRRDRNVRGVLSNARRRAADPEQGTIPEGARLSGNAQEVKPLIAEEPAAVPAEEKAGKEEDDDEDEEDSDRKASTTPSATVLTGCSQPVYLKVISDRGYELVEKEPQTASPSNLEIFEARQKMLEEQNKKRKEMLTKALDDRKKHTYEEAKRLKSIQDELHKLDLLMRNDIGILKKKIEDVSIEFGEMQKKFDKAKKEYLEAKQRLFGTLERKEMLTNHLCTIIEQNEMRKAQKLSELMEKLRVNEENAEAKSDLSAVINSPYYESALKNDK